MGIHAVPYDHILGWLVACFFKAYSTQLVTSPKDNAWGISNHMEHRALS